MTSRSCDGAPCANRESQDLCWYKVLPTAQLKRRMLRKVRVAGSFVLLARLEDGTLTAASAVCPHEGADLSRGRVYMGAIDCSRHHYLYDLRTGLNRYPHDVYPTDLAASLAALPLYPVREKDSWIWVGRRRA